MYVFHVLNLQKTPTVSVAVWSFWAWEKAPPSRCIVPGGGEVLDQPTNIKVMCHSFSNTSQRFHVCDSESVMVQGRVLDKQFRSWTDVFRSVGFQQSADSSCWLKDLQSDRPFDILWAGLSFLHDPAGSAPAPKHDSAKTRTSSGSTDPNHEDMRKERSCRGCFDPCLWCGSWLSQTALESSLCTLDVCISSICSVSNITDPTDPKPVSSIKGTLLCVTPAVVTRGWLHFTATFYHVHQIWNRGASGPSASDKSKEAATTGAAGVPRTAAWYHWFQVSDLHGWNAVSKVFLFSFSLNSKQFTQSLITCFCLTSLRQHRVQRVLKWKNMDISTCGPEVFGWEETSELTDSSCWVMYSEHCDSLNNSSDEVTGCDKDM